MVQKFLIFIFILWSWLTTLFYLESKIFNSEFRVQVTYFVRITLLSTIFDFWNYNISRFSFYILWEADIELLTE